MTDKVAGGPIDLGEGAQPLPEGDHGAPLKPSGEDLKKDQPPTEVEKFTKEQVTEIATAEAEKAVQALREEYEGRDGHLAKVRSDLQTAHNAQKAEWGQEKVQFQNDLHQLQIKDMDENTRNAYEVQLYRERAVQLDGQLEQAKAELEASRGTGPYLQALVDKFDVDVSSLDMTDVDKLSETAFTAAGEAHQKSLDEIETLQEKISELEKDPGSKTPTEKKPLPKAPDVVTRTGGNIDTAPTLLDIRKSVSQKAGLDRIISEAELFELAENPDETGVDLNVVLQSIQNEIDATDKED